MNFESAFFGPRSIQALTAYVGCHVRSNVADGRRTCLAGSRARSPAAPSANHLRWTLAPLPPLLSPHATRAQESSTRRARGRRSRAWGLAVQARRRARWRSRSGAHGAARPAAGERRAQGAGEAHAEPGGGQAGRGGTSGA